jgi:diketogulonate reductase-like aldo/keto reductase
MPMLGLGVWQMAEGLQTEQAVDWPLNAGYRHLDTATIYGNERSVGAAIARSGLPREDLFVTTKWPPFRRGPATELPRSLERLQLEFVDLYLIHWPVPVRATQAWGELERLRERGLARAIGVSNYGSERLSRLVEGAAIKPAVNQVQFSPFHFRRRLLEACDRNGVVLEAYSPLDRGRRLDHPVIVEIARRLERTPAEVMLRWAIQHNAIVIPKSSTGGAHSLERSNLRLRSQHSRDERTRRTRPDQRNRRGALTPSRRDARVAVDADGVRRQRGYGWHHKAERRRCLSRVNRSCSPRPRAPRSPPRRRPSASRC